MMSGIHPYTQQGTGGCLCSHSSFIPTGSQLLDTNTTPAALFGSHPPRNTLNYSSYSMKHKKKNNKPNPTTGKILLKYSNLWFIKSTQLSKKSERRNVAFVCRLTGRHASLTASLSKLPDRAQSRASSWKCRLLWRREKQRTTVGVSFAKEFQISVPWSGWMGQ